MKRFLALLLAALMLAAGTVSALAEEGTGTPSTDTPPVEDEPPVQEDAPITIDGRFPGETLETTWSIYFSGDTVKSFTVETDNEVTKCVNENPNIDVSLQLRMGEGKFLDFQIKNPLTGEEDIGKEEKDTIKITLDDGETYTFYLTVRYRGGILLNQVGSHWSISRFILGTDTTLSFNVHDPSNIFVLPYDVEVVQETMSGAVLEPEDQLVQIGEIKQDGKSFSFTLTPLKAGAQRLHVFAIDANGYRAGKGWEIEVSADGTFTDDVPLIKETRESPSDNSANSSKTVSALQEATVALETGTGELPSNATTVTTASGESLTAIPVKLSSGSAAISFDTANALGESKAALSARVDNGAMEVILPGGFGQVTEPGRIYYPFDFDRNPSIADEMKSAVKEEDARSEAVKAGGNMVLPTTATVTLRTKLEDGPVNIYYYNEETKKYTRLASATVTDGYVTFATRQMGHMVLTTGTI